MKKKISCNIDFYEYQQNFYRFNYSLNNWFFNSYFFCIDISSFHSVFITTLLVLEVIRFYHMFLNRMGVIWASNRRQYNLKVGRFLKNPCGATGFEPVTSSL